MAGKVTFVTVNVDEEPQLTRRYGISSLPTLKVFCGGREIGELVGALPAPRIEATLRQTVDEHQECLAASSPAQK